jgi:hypothetical protein
MNEEQVKSGIRWLITTFGGVVAGFFAAKGWFTVDQVLSVLNSGTFIGVVTSGVILVWGLITHKKSNAVAVVNAMPEVQGVVTAPTADGRALANAVPSATVAVAGTQAAAQVAKPA